MAMELGGYGNRDFLVVGDGRSNTTAATAVVVLVLS